MEFLNYLLKVSACSALFFGFYLLVLRRLTFFKINRFYLLITLLLSFTIPTLHFNLERQVEVQQPTEIIAPATSQIELAPGFGGPTPTAEIGSPIKESFDWLMLLPYCYGLVVTALLCLAIWRLVLLLKHAKKNLQEVNGLKLVYKSVGFTNCSFFNYVFIDENSLTRYELQVLLAHEEIHAKQFHSIDKIILMIAKAVLWFNPIVYFYDKALEQTHEFEADEATSQNFGTESYANLLVRLAIAKSEMPLVHNFVKSPIKERIKMLFNSKTKDMKKLIYVLALPIGLGLLWGFTVDVVEVPRASESIELKVNKNLATDGNSLWGKTLVGRVKSILVTEVGEILNFKYGETTVGIFNLAKGKVKVGDELLVTISGTVNDITVTDAKGHIIKKLEKPCYNMSLMKTKQGEILYQQKVPERGLITKTYSTDAKGFRIEHITLNTLSGKLISARIINGNKQKSVIWIYVNDRLYSETDASRFDQKFIAELSLKRGYSTASHFNIPAVRNKNNAYVFWFGNEPKLSDYAKKNRAYYEKYNGKTVEGKVVGFTYSDSKVIDGFLVTTTNGETLKAKVEQKFAKQTAEMIGKGDNVAITIYNANYIKNSKYPVLTSYKISKGGKLLYDRWPKVAKTTAKIDKAGNDDVKVSPYIVNKPEEIPFSDAYILLANLKNGNDSLKSYTVMGNSLFVKGNIQLNIDGFLLAAKFINVDKYSNLITAHLATLSSPDGSSLTGDEIVFDVTKKLAKTTKPKGYYKSN